jgi:hypothetical protein
MILGISFAQLFFVLVSQCVTGIVVFVVTALNEGRRQRLTANFERKQQHYSDLFEVLYKVTKGLSLENTNVFTSPGTFDVAKIEDDLATKDLLRIDALSNIWATERVRSEIEIWANHRKHLMLAFSSIKGIQGLPIADGEFAKKKTAAQLELDSMDAQMERIIQSIHDDLLISRRGIWKILARQQKV